VAANYARDRAGAERIAHSIAAAGGRALAVCGDVANEADVVELFVRAERELGPLAGLVNNAGITGGSARVADLSRDVLERTLAVNVTESFLCAREAVRRMARSRGGAGGSSLAKLVTSVPLERAGASEEVAEAILWLMFVAASYVTGTILDVAGGR
jgi:NAD(P)-dependent dehydrogenase (short-subunit alcohol dehydrogenase family)